ncbi:hypothetical protein PV729_46675 [Streptomyces europaeiscabiei]|uniref:Uncharacterized protein n=1 Tax=Streptomyces europaeiscabiei TaxID=146819 RepID=A0ABU4NC10_9ACTN|nr:hypothetical protein [Streptomyces europaeiscabiei]MDX3559052.1 hypothetical protein [Streptomyces europaeiscabiei]MDX3699627.1 hypothetical protein [Streptomyces europaeiscabiei]
MSDALDKAEAAVTAAETNTAAVQLALAAVELAKAATAQQQAPRPPACDHQHKAGRSTGEWLAIGCAVCVGGVGIAFASIAIAIGGMSVAILALVLRSMWRDYQKGR